MTQSDDLAVLLRSEDHESAFWNAFMPNGGYPWAPGSDCYEAHIWRAYEDLEDANLLRRCPDDDIFRNGVVRRAKFRPMDGAAAVFERLKAYRAEHPYVSPWDDIGEE